MSKSLAYVPGALALLAMCSTAHAVLSPVTPLTETITVATELTAPAPVFEGNPGLVNKIQQEQELGAFSYTNTNPVAARLAIEVSGESVVSKQGQGNFYNTDSGDKISFKFVSPDGVNRLNGLSTKSLEPNEVASVKLLSNNTQKVTPGVYTLTATASMWN